MIMAGQSVKASAEMLKNAVIDDPTAEHTATVGIHVLHVQVQLRPENLSALDPQSIGHFDHFKRLAGQHPDPSLYLFFLYRSKSSLARQPLLHRRGWRVKLGLSAWLMRLLNF